jgi:hypothetical protein
MTDLSSFASSREMKMSHAKSPGRKEDKQAV